MFSTAGNPQEAKPAVIDGRVVMLPTLSGLISGKRGAKGNDSRHLWNALAAAVMAEDGFDDLDGIPFDDEEGPLAEVIDMDAYRRSHELA